MPTSPSLSSPVRYLRGVGPARSQQLATLGVHTVWDLLHHFPRGYQDRSQIVPIDKLQPDAPATICGTITEVRLRRVRGRTRSLVNVGVEDGTATLRATWFNQPYLARTFRKGDQVILSGRATLREVWQMAAPEYEVLDSAQEEPTSRARIVPVYPLTAGLSGRVLRNILGPAVEALAPLLPDVLPERIRTQRGLCSITTAIRNIHQPKSQGQLRRARERLKYEELFLLEVAMAARRQAVKSSGALPLRITPTIDRRIRRRFPFVLTPAQEKVIDEISADLASAHPMNRLLQGDVGSGKTVVAVYAMLAAVANRCQAAIMAPTEILAEQHDRTLGRYLAGSKVRVALLLGGRKSAERRAVRTEVASGEAGIVIGTHALIEKPVAFARLGLVVVDEQHKFGVLQRARLRWKGRAPHVLVMTATPIPRSLALTLFGDLDVSTITHLPPGRQPVRTTCVSRAAQQRAWQFVEEQVRQGRQAFVVYPLVEESEKLDLKAATEMAEQLRQRFADLHVGLLHGRMKAEEKQRVMTAFRDRRIHLLVSTVVVEVGIDVPNATVMVVEHAERFGLAQLHQLRGRIGRGEHASHCLLFADARSAEARRRLQVLTDTSDGFRIAEEDLKMRGPGEFFGTLQHGLPRLRIADLAQDIALARRARDDAFALVDRDPALRGDAGRLLGEGIERQFGDSLRLVEIG